MYMHICILYIYIYIICVYHSVCRVYMYICIYIYMYHWKTNDSMFHHAWWLNHVEYVELNLHFQNIGWFNPHFYAPKFSMESTSGQIQ